MSGGQTKNAALTTSLAFHYQVLIGLDKCFSLQSDQAVWIEKDGDVSLTDSNVDLSTQTEIKDYSAPLTDHHENLWKTLKNWLAPEFNQAAYGALILHTTQSFGVTSRLKNWNIQKPEERLTTLKAIYAERTPEELNAEKPADIIKFQKIVMDSRDDNDLINLLAKIVLHVEADDLSELRRNFFRKLDGFIPPANQQAFSEGLIGFVYEQADSTSWVITKDLFDQKRESLTAKYGPSPFTIPDFTHREATAEEVNQHTQELFAQKIVEIEYSEVLPEAVGNWLELRNSLIEELHGFPQFRVTTNTYREQWISSFRAKYRIACRKRNDPLSDSQDLYDQETSSNPFSIDGYPSPSLAFRNGLIHDAMDDNDLDLKWRVSHE